MYKIKILFKKLIRLFKYTPIIWKSEDWDFSYLLQLVEFKLKRMRNSLDEYYICGNGKKIEVRKQIDKTLNAILKYNDDIDMFRMIEPEYLYNVEMFWKKNKDKNTNSMRYRFIDGEEVPENHDFYKYQRKYILRQYIWKQACWNRIWNTIKDNGEYWYD